MRLMYSDGHNGINVIDIKSAEMVDKEDGWIIRFTTVDDEKISIKPKRDMEYSEYENCLNYLKNLLDNGYLNLINGTRVFSVWE